MCHTVDVEDAEHKLLRNWQARIAAFLSMLRYRFVAWRRGSKGSIRALLPAQRQVEVERLSGSHLP
jgi:hypothetical protein